MLSSSHNLAFFTQFECFLWMIKYTDCMSGVYAMGTAIKKPNFEELFQRDGFVSTHHQNVNIFFAIEIFKVFSFLQYHSMLYPLYLILVKLISLHLYNFISNFCTSATWNLYVNVLRHIQFINDVSDVLQ